jgi:MFS transporter, DHA1 family, inner membrane transport protein
MAEKRERGHNLILLALFVTGFATQAAVIIVSMLMIEIGQTFSLPIGIIGQLITASAIAAVIFALMTGVLTMRYSSRTLLLGGISLYLLTAIGCYLAPNFSIMMLAFALSGLATAIAYPMLGTIIGEVIPSSERSRALGIITAGQPASLILGSPTVVYIASQWGWRNSYLLFMLPIILLSFAIVFIGVPSTPKKADDSRSSSLSGFRGVLKNKSARACLLGALIFQASMYTSFTFAISFLRMTYDVSPSLSSLLMSLVACGSALGSLTVASFVRKIGGRRASVCLSLAMGVFVLVLYSSGLWWFSVGVLVPWAYVAGAGFVSGDTLTLDQVPEYRGTLMSLNVVARNLGMTIGAFVGGGLLLLVGYGGFGLIMGLLGVAAALIYQFFTREAPQ